MGLFSTAPATHLPPAEGVRLDGSAIALPAGFEARATLVVLSFQDDVAALSDQWARLGRRLAETYPGLEVSEVIVWPPRLRMLGDLALTRTRLRAEAAGTLRTSVVLYAKRKPIRRALQIRRDSDVTAFLVDRGGEIAWRGDGEIDMHEIESLEPAVQRLLAA